MKQIPYLDLKVANQNLSESLNEAFQKVLNSGWFILGKALEKFEDEFAAYLDQIMWLKWL